MSERPNNPNNPAAVFEGEGSENETKYEDQEDDDVTLMSLLCSERVTPITLITPIPLITHLLALISSVM